LVYLLLPGDASPETGREYRQATRKASRVSPRLGTFPGGTTSFATAINNLRQVVDTSTGQP
jgi:hypothetical protein